METRRAPAGGAGDGTALSAPAVVVIAAESLVRLGIAASLEGTFNVVALAGSTGEANDALAAERPDLAVISLVAPLSGGTADATCAALMEAHRAVRFIALVAPRDHSLLRVASRTGCRGIFESTIEPGELRAALLRVLEGGVEVQPSLVGALIGGLKGDAHRLARLVPREAMALQLLARGLSGAALADSMACTRRAADLAVEKATHRLGAKHRAEAVAIAVRDGLIA